MWQATMWEPASKRGERLPLAAEQAQLARLRRQVDERWRALALAAERVNPASPASLSARLDRLYDAYMRAVDAYVARQRALARRADATAETQRRAS
ncbi:MAG: hypothetical protein ACHQ1E_01200 [Ktedonobacterales bacterium]